MTGYLPFRDWARLVFGPEDGDKFTRDRRDAIARELDRAIFHGTTIQESETMTDDYLTTHPLDPEPPPEDLNEAERLGLLVGAKYGEALAERDQARDLATQAVAHLKRVLDTMPEGTFAVAEAAVADAREFVTAVESTQTPD